MQMKERYRIMHTLQGTLRASVVVIVIADDYKGPERALWCIEPVYRRAKGQS